MASGSTTRGLDCILGKTSWKWQSGTGTGCPGSGGVPILQTVKKTHECGTWGQGLVMGCDSAGETVGPGDCNGLFQAK